MTRLKNRDTISFTKMILKAVEPAALPPILTSIFSNCCSLRRLTYCSTTSFISFLSFLAEDPDLTEIGLFQPPGCTETKASLAVWIADNIAQEQELGVFSKDVDALTVARCFVGMIDQAARVARDEMTLEELAMGCARVLCKGIGH